MNQYSLIIFDWDGTLVDSVPNIVMALRLASREMALPELDEASYRGIIGLSLGPALQTLYPSLNDQRVAELRESYKNHHFQLEQQASRPFAGVVDGLECMKQSGTRLAVATGKRRAGLQRSMAANGYERFFDASRTADEAHSKPHPDMIEQLLHELNIPAQKALMVGDSSFDMEMAVNASVDRIAVTYGAQSRNELEAWEPLLVADHFNEFVHWLGYKPACANINEFMS